jgi:hypothetical protein
MVGATFIYRSLAALVLATKAKTRGLSESRAKMENLISVPFASLATYNGQHFAQGRGVVTVAELAAGLSCITVSYQYQQARPALCLYTFRASL